MLLLHASFHANNLHVWGESPSDSPPLSRKSNGRKKRQTVEAWPYDNGAERLATALAAILPRGSGKWNKPETMVLWLPTLGAQAVASSALVAEPPRVKGNAELKPWAVTSFSLTAHQAIDMLCAGVNRETLVPGVVVGKSLEFWIIALRLAGALVAREQFLPGLEERGGTFRACWKPIFAGADAQRLAQLTAAMPPACRAMSSSADGPPEVPAASVLTEFLNGTVDALVRAAARTPALVSANGGRSRKTAPAFDSVHDRWLHALTNGDGELGGTSAERTQLAEQVQQWQRPVALAATAPFRLCFRLEEPPEDAEAEATSRPSARQSWYLRYLLQGADDPSLLVPLTDAWQARGRSAALLGQRSFDYREYLLAALGQAVGLCPSIERSLKTAEPNGLELETTGAHGFLTEHAGLLEQAGFGILLPAWWTRKGTKLRLTARAVVKTPAMQGASGMSLEQIIKFDWQVALGDEVLSLKELELLARLKQPLVKVRGQWVQLRAEEIQAALDFWKNKPTGQANVREIVRMALGQATVPGELEFAGVGASGWMRDFLARLEGQATLEELAAPCGFQGTLRPYQLRGYSWLGFLRHWGLGACLADDMGLGKTVQTLALIQRDWEANGRRPTLLVCPTSVVGNWQKEAGRFTPQLPVLVHHGSGRRKGVAWEKEAAGAALVLTSYALLHRDQEIFKKVNWGGVILDEAQNIKNPETKQARAARSIPADCRIALTGTPVENHVGDLWSIMEFLNPGFLGTQADFRRSFFYPIQAGQDPEATRRLQRLTGPFILRRLKTDKSIITDLPDKLEMKVFCTLTKEQASLYAAVVKDAEAKLKSVAEGIQRKGLVLATLSKLKQVCNHPAQFLGDNSSIPGRSGKLARLTEMLEELLDTGERALIFTQFTEMGALIQRHLQETFGREVLFLHGGTSKKQRDHMVERFQEASAEGPRLFLLSLKAGGTGLNLTAASRVVHFDRWWNPAVENQATDRAFRIGQVRNVQVHKFLCIGTLEEKIDEMIERKQALARKVVGTGEGWLTELSNQQLKELFALRKEALGE